MLGSYWHCMVSVLASQPPLKTRVLTQGYPLLPLQINYQPSTIRQNSESKIQPHPDQQLVQKEEIRGQRTRGDYPPQQQSDFQQAGDRYRSFDPVRCCCKLLVHPKLAKSALAATYMKTLHAGVGSLRHTLLTGWLTRSCPTWCARSGWTCGQRWTLGWAAG